MTKPARRWEQKEHDHWVCSDLDPEWDLDIFVIKRRDSRRWDWVIARGTGCACQACAPCAGRCPMVFGSAPTSTRGMLAAEGVLREMRERRIGPRIRAALDPRSRTAFASRATEVWARTLNECSGSEC